MTTDYLGVFWSEIGAGWPETLVALAVVAYVAVRNVRGFSPNRYRRVLVLVAADLAVQLLIILVGSRPVSTRVLVEQVDLGTTPAWDEVVFALTLTVVAFTALESAAGLAGEIGIRRGRGSSGS
jgi:APA family basic amino acid/polyamine antiporter